MCGRASSARSAPALRRLTGAVRAVARSEYRPSWNVGPGNRAPVLRRVVAPVRPRDEDAAEAPAQAAPAAVAAKAGAKASASAAAGAAGAAMDGDAANPSVEEVEIGDDSVVVVVDSDEDVDNTSKGKPSPAKKAKTDKKHAAAAAAAAATKKGGADDDHGAQHKTPGSGGKKDDDDNDGQGNGPSGGGGAVRRGGGGGGGASSSSSSGSAANKGGSAGSGGGSASRGSGSGGENKEADLVLQEMRWGILPPYAAAQGKGTQYVINARSETVHSKGLFKRLLDRRQRCIVPVDGFYEWEKKADPFGGKDKKQPFFIHLPDRPDLQTRKQILTNQGTAAPAAAATPTGTPSASGASAASGPSTGANKGSASDSKDSGAAKWVCSACTVRNAEGRTKCGTCGTPRDSSSAGGSAAAPMNVDDDTPTASASAAASTAGKPASASGSSAAAAAAPAEEAVDTEVTDTLGDSVLTNRPLMLLAGLYDEWTDSATGEQQFSYTILTTDANSSSAWLHDRLPLILDEASAAIWLDTEKYSFDECLKFVRPYNSALIFYAVSNSVNYMANKGIDCVEPLDSVEAKKKAGGISKFFTKAPSTTSGKETAGKTPKGDPHSWPGAIDAWKRVEEQIAAYTKKHAAAAASNGSGSAAVSKAQSLAAPNAGKRKDRDVPPPKSPSKSPVKSGGGGKAK